MIFCRLLASSLSKAIAFQNYHIPQLSKAIAVQKYHILPTMSYSVDLRAMRQPYREDDSVLLESNLPTRDPIELFKIWFEEAKKLKEEGKILEPNAVCLCTADRSGIPSSRMVLLKGFGPDGFKIFTNLASRKGKELIDNPHAALLFYWDPTNKQVRIEGKVELLPESESREYFETRPKRSQIAAAISEQSSIVESRDVLVQRYKELEEKYAESTFIPKPESWGGIRVIPNRFEFWQGQSSRLHDRILFTLQNGAGETKEGGKSGRREVSSSSNSEDQDSEGGRRADASCWIMQRLQP